MAAACTKLSPTSPAFAAALGPTQKALLAAVELKDKNRGSKDFNGLTMVAEGIPALGWVTLVSPQPQPVPVGKCMYSFPSSTFAGLEAGAVRE